MAQQKKRFLIWDDATEGTMGEYKGDIEIGKTGFGGKRITRRKVNKKDVY